MINRVILEGHLGATPQRYETPSNKVYTYISLPLANPYKRDNEDAEWMQCQVWNKTAEYVLNNAVIGDLITVDGRLRNRKYTDRNTGKPAYRPYVEIERLTLHRTGKRDGTEKTGSQIHSRNQQASSQEPPASAPRSDNSHPERTQEKNPDMNFDQAVFTENFDPFDLGND